MENVEQNIKFLVAKLEENQLIIGSIIEACTPKPIDTIEVMNLKRLILILIQCGIAEVKARVQ